MVTASGIPLNPLLLGLLLEEFEGHVYIAGLPIGRQELGATVLAPLARLAGYGVDLDERRTGLKGRSYPAQSSSSSASSAIP